MPPHRRPPLESNGAALALALVVASAWSLAAWSLAGASAPERLAAVDVVGTAFRIELTGGRVLSAEQLAGSTLSLVPPGETEPRQVRIDQVVVDPLDPQRETLLYRMHLVDVETGDTTEICEPDQRGERWAFPVKGQWDDEGRFISDRGFTLTCASGAQGKCVRFGYKPWRTLPDRRSLAAYHQACVHMVRANYCGDRGTTRDGMPIDVYDDAGILERDRSSASDGMQFEAAWGTDGALCVAHTRVPDHVSLEALATECPRLSGRLGETACTESVARAAGPAAALLYNRSPERGAPGGT
jgi:hypothetical protein